MMESVRASIPMRATAVAKVSISGFPLVLCALLAVAACGRQADKTTPEGPIPAVTAAEADVLRRAEERLIKRCMAGLGFEYRERSKPAVDGAADRTFRYVVDDVAWAKRYGYGAASPVREKSRPARGSSQPGWAGLSSARKDAWQLALVGSGKQISARLPGGTKISASDHGCQAEARKTLYRDLPTWYQSKKISGASKTLVFRQVSEDPRYRTANGAWARCVRDSGIEIADPVALRKDLANRSRNLAYDQAHALEIRTAVLEATCADSARFGQTIRDLERKYEPAVRESFGRELRDLARLEHAALPRAESALSQE